MAKPSQSTLDTNGDPVVREHVMPTEEISYSLMSMGMKRRMGVDATKSQALRYTHIKFLEEQYERMYQSATSPEDKHEAATAAAACLMFWGGWLRGGEGFGFNREDFEMSDPSKGPQYGLQEGVGFLGFRLLEETKSSPYRTADVLIADTFWSGLSPGKWFRRMLEFEPADGKSLFSTARCKKWDSHYFRKTHVWPHLEVLRIQRDPHLANCQDVEGQRISDRFYSMHSWRRGGNTFAQEHWSGINRRKATTVEIYEHGRWARQKKGSSEAMDAHYREWDIAQRLAISLFCL